jgi:membrane protease YdiL (CAAX protease family)
MRMNEVSPVRFAFGAAIGIALLPQLVLAVVVALGGEDLPMLPLIGAGEVLLLLVPTIMAARLQPIPRRELFRLNNPGLIGFAFLVAGLLSIWPLLQTYLLVQELYLLPTSLLETPAQYDKVLRDLFGSTGAVDIMLAIVVAAVIPGVSEELLFRGLVLRSLQERMRPAMAIAIAAILFGAVHMSPIHFVPLVALGAFFGLLTVVTESIYPAMTAHALFNSISIVGVVLNLGGSDTTPHTVDDLLSILPLTAISFVIFCWVVRWMLHYGRMKDKG